MVMPQANDSSAHSNQEFKKGLRPIPTSLDSWSARQRPLLFDEIGVCQCRSGKLCRLATVSRPDISARLSRIAPRMSPLPRSDCCRINDLVKTAKDRTQATVLKYAPAPHPLIQARGDFDGRMRARGEKCVVVQWLLRDGLMRRMVTSILRADAGVALQVGLLSPTNSGPCRIPQRASVFTRKLVRIISGGEVSALSEKIDRVACLRDFYAPFTGASPGMFGLEDCESLFSHLRNSKAVAGKCPVRHFPNTQEALG